MLAIIPDSFTTTCFHLNEDDATKSWKGYQFYIVSHCFSYVKRSHYGREFFCIQSLSKSTLEIVHKIWSASSWYGWRGYTMHLIASWISSFFSLKTIFLLSVLWSGFLIWRGSKLWKDIKDLIGKNLQRKQRKNRNSGIGKEHRFCKEFWFSC